MTLSHITVPAVSPRVQYVADGQQTDFVYPFPIFAADDLAVMRGAAVLTGGYTVLGAGDSGGGTVQFLEPPALGSIITLRRALTIRRTTDILQGSAMRADTFNDEFDRQVAVSQDLAEQIGRTLRAPAHDRPASLVVPERDQRANRTLVFDEDGNATVGDAGIGPSGVAIYNPAMPGAVERTVQGRLGDRVSVKDFGAVGDGLTDDTAAILAALAAAAAVHAPAGTYLVGAPIRVGGGQSLTGDGAASVLKATAAGIAVVELVAERALVADLAVEGGAVGVKLYGRDAPARHCRVSGVRIDGATTGLQLDGHTDPNRPCAMNTVEAVTIRDPALHGVHLTLSGAGVAPQGNRLRGVVVDGQGGSMTGCGFFVEQAEQATCLTDCEARVPSTAAAGVRLGPGSDRTFVTNLRTHSPGAVTNVHIQAGASESAIVNLSGESAGSAVWDQSAGPTVRINAGWPDRHALGEASFDLVTAAAADLATVRWGDAYYDGLSTVDLAMTTRLHLVSAWSGAVTARLPDPTAVPGEMTTIKKTDPSANAVTVEDVNGAGPDNAPVVLANRYDRVTVMSNGAAWWAL
ncbi:MAG: hypothetical protein GVY28_12935 [Alphaproteobacteria bacterium]|jgi:hypothetical protein|nr:hypothetical protein [Alphaproteobacteria bacterium]